MSADLTQMVVNLTPEAREALELSAEREGRSATDIVNLAVLMYERLSAAPAGAKIRLTSAATPGGRS